MLENNSTSSKSLNTFHGFAPKMIVRAQGATVIDEKNCSYLDAGMALGSVSIGYCCSEVDNYVVNALRSGVNFSRPSILEEKLSNLILKNIKGDMVVRYAKSSSMLLSIIPRICRYITKKDYVAYPKGCYLGNTDWYFAKAYNNGGIPNQIKELSLLFEAGNIQSLNNLFKEFGNKLACLIMEPYRQHIYSVEYYSLLREYCYKYNVLLVFDETITGYRFSYPLAQYNIHCQPDITITGKAMANGYALAAAILKLELYKMCLSEKVYDFSTTHAGENIGLSAAISTLEYYEKFNVVGDINLKGKILVKKLKEMIGIFNLQKYISILGQPTYFKILISSHTKSYDFTKLLFKTFFEEKIIFRGFISICYTHSLTDINKIVSAFELFCLLLRKEISND